MSDVNDIIGRMVQAAGAKNMSQMLEMFGFAKSSGSTWRKRKKIPDGSIARVAEQLDISFEWLKTGQGEMQPTADRSPGLQGHVNQAQAEYQAKPITLTQQEFVLLTLFRQLNDQWKSDIISSAALGVADSSDH